MALQTLLLSVNLRLSILKKIYILLYTIYICMNEIHISKEMGKRGSLLFSNLTKSSVEGELEYLEVRE